MSAERDSSAAHHLSGDYAGSKNPYPSGKASPDPAPQASWGSDAYLNPSQFTFYREGSPIPSDSDKKEDSEAGGGLTLAQALESSRIPISSYHQHDSDSSSEVVGQRTWLFWLGVIGTIILLLGVGLGVGIGVGLGKNMSRGAADIASSPSSTSATPTASSPSATSTSAPCPVENGTVYVVPGSDKAFLQLCGIDYGGSSEAVDIKTVMTASMIDCMNNCAGYPGCTGCGWGYIEGDIGPEYRCWLKSHLTQPPHEARLDWAFAVLQ